MTINSETTTTSAQLAHIVKSVKQLTARERLTLAKLLLESVLNAKPEVQDAWPAGFLEETAGAWVGEPLVRDAQVDYAAMNETVTLPNRYPVTLHVPRVLYAWLQQRADQSQHTVEDELLEIVATALPVNDALPVELMEALSPLPLLEDEALWRAARSHLATEFASELEHLHRKRQREGLTASETQTLSRLVAHYERAMLVRAQAARILKERGHDVSTLLTPQ